MDLNEGGEVGDVPVDAVDPFDDDHGPEGCLPTGKTCHHFGGPNRIRNSCQSLPLPGRVTLRFRFVTRRKPLLSSCLARTRRCRRRRFPSIRSSDSTAAARLEKKNNIEQNIAIQAYPFTYPKLLIGSKHHFHFSFRTYRIILL